MNLTLGAVMILSAACLSTLLIFRGLVQMAWVISLGGASLAWQYLLMYYLSLWAVIWYHQRRTTPFGLALLNAGGLPPLTGFMIKLRALGSLTAPTGGLLLAGSGAALVSYVRVLLGSRLRWEKPPVPLLLAITLGSV
jgi:hypothetical protein